VSCEERELETSFGATHVLVSGPAAAPPLVLLHGAGATATMWHPIIEPLSKSYRCYCVDTITDANKSIATQRIRGVSGYVDWLRQVFTALDIESARVGGLSYGGWLAGNLAGHAPELVDRLLLLCPAATLAPLPAEFYFRVFSTGLLRSPGLARRSMQWMSATPDATSDPGVDLIETILVSCRTVRFEMRPPALLSDDELRAIRAPTTVLIGDREVIYRGGPAAALARAEALLPDVRTVLVPGASHLLPLDAPRQLADEMLLALR
jgi:pimeloyl-ACP methyl ester carboxylesterase